jgi:hypothetical protein
MGEISSNRHLVVVRCSGGFGNQIFYIIFALYLSHRYKTIIKLCQAGSFHSSRETYPLNDVFNKLDRYVEIISIAEIKGLENRLGITPVTSDQFSISTLPNELNQSMIFHTNPFNVCYQMYKTLPEAYRLCLGINIDLVTESTKRLAATPYIAVNIRYGEKLCYALQDRTFFKNAPKGMHHKYLLYSPHFYVDIILRLKEEWGLPIYIISDSPEIVEQFILCSNKGIADVFDTRYLDDFYLLTQSEIMVASHSTFSFSAGYLRKNNHVYLLKKPEQQWDQYELPEDSAISPDWNLIDEPKYLLNSNQKLLREMADHFGKCSYFKHWYLQQGDEYSHIKKLFDSAHSS